MHHFKSRKIDKDKWYYQLASHSLASLHTHTEHKPRRTLLDPLFNGEMLRRFNTSFDDHISKFHVRLGEAARTGEPVNASHLLWKLMNDIIAHYVLIVEPNGRTGPLSTHDKARSLSALRLATLFRQCPMSLFFGMRLWPVIKYLSPITPLIEHVGFFLCIFLTRLTYRNSLLISKSRPFSHPHSLNRISHTVV